MQHHPGSNGRSREAILEAKVAAVVIVCSDVVVIELLMLASNCMMPLPVAQLPFAILHMRVAMVANWTSRNEHDLRHDPSTKDRRCAVAGKRGRWSNTGS